MSTQETIKNKLILDDPAVVSKILNEVREDKLGYANEDGTLATPKESTKDKNSSDVEDNKTTPQVEIDNFNKESILAGPGNIPDDDGWYPKPFIAHQAQNYPKSCKRDRIVVRCLDLSKSEDLDEYNKILNADLEIDSNMSDLKQVIKFAETEGTWKVLLSYSIFKFKHPLVK